MSKVVFEKKHKEQSLIPNSQLEQMFLSVADDSQMREYTTLVNKGLIHTASAYASHRVQRTFMYLRDMYIKNGGDIDYLQYILWHR